MTNFEKIKEMTLEELAIKLCDLQQGTDYCEKCPVSKYCSIGIIGFEVYLKREADD